MDAEAGVSLLEYALEQEENRQIFERWVQGAQYSVSFEDFKNSLKKPLPRKTEDILQDVENILHCFEKER